VALIIDSTDEDIDYIVMADDGRGSEISIPAVLISKDDGKVLTDFYVANKEKADKIKLEVDFIMEHPNNTVNYDLFTTSDNEMVYKIMMDFYQYQKELINVANLRVHYITYQHPLYNSLIHSSNFPQDDCLGRGKYCNNPGKFGIKDGREIVHENIKQKCVYKYAYQQTGVKTLYWEYLNEFYSSCCVTNKFNKECSMTASKTVGLPTDEINKCIHDSYNVTDDQRKREDFELYAENTLLNESNEERRIYLLSYIPSITINGRTFMGNWIASNLFEAICAGFNKKPEVCYDEGAFQKKSVSVFALIMIVLLVLIVNVAIFLACKKYIRKRIVEKIESTDINHKINTVVTSYLALRDNK
jgi:hypothetical protein